MMNVLFWDIDGTLLTTGGAGIYAWEEAFTKITGKPIDLTKLQTAGLTDVQIAAKILEENNAKSFLRQTSQFLKLYEKYLPDYLPKKQGSVLTNVKEILRELKTQNNVISMLLTGNTQAGAKSKLSYYELDHYFSKGAFADGLKDRTSIACKALSIAKIEFKNLSLDNVYVIGDTPHDIHCGKAIGAKTIAVASGPFSTDELLIHQPWWVIEQLPSPNIFFQNLK